MTAKQARYLVTSAIATACVAAYAAGVGAAQPPTEAQLKALLPDVGDLPGYVRVQPAAEFPPIEGTKRTDTSLPDTIVRHKLIPAPSGAGFERITGIGRTLYTADGNYYVSMALTFYETPDEARAELAKHMLTPMRWFASSLGALPRIGDESWTPVGGSAPHILVRVGPILLDVFGSQSSRAAREQLGLQYPPDEVEAIAETVLVRLARLGISRGDSGPLSLSVNGVATGTACIPACARTMAPVLDVARAAGWEADWSDKTGRLVLSHAGRSIELRAFSREVDADGTREPTRLKSPVLRDRGRPLMDLEELVSLLGGRIEKSAPGKVSVRI